MQTFTHTLRLRAHSHMFLHSHCILIQALMHTLPQSHPHQLMLTYTHTLTHTHQPSLLCMLTHSHNTHTPFQCTGHICSPQDLWSTRAKHPQNPKLLQPLLLPCFFYLSTGGKKEVVWGGGEGEKKKGSQEGGRKRGTEERNLCANLRRVQHVVLHPQPHWSRFQCPLLKYTEVPLPLCTLLGTVPSLTWSGCAVEPTGSGR